MINRTSAKNLGWCVANLLALSMPLTGCEYMDLSQCEEAMAISRDEGNSCPAIQCACQEFLVDGDVRDDGCYEYHHPVTDEVFVDCECRMQLDRGDLPSTELRPPDQLVDDWGVFAQAGQDSQAGLQLTAVDGGFEFLEMGSTQQESTGQISRVMPSDLPPMPTECEAAAAEGACVRVDCLCKWFLAHLEDGCLTYEHPETGEEIVDCDCRPRSNPDGDGPADPSDQGDVVGELPDAVAIAEESGEDSPPNGDAHGSGGLTEDTDAGDQLDDIAPLGDGGDGSEEVAHRSRSRGRARRR